jgi:hypothetical protein
VIHVVIRTPIHHKIGSTLGGRSVGAPPRHSAWSERGGISPISPISSDARGYPQAAADLVRLCALVRDFVSGDRTRSKRSESGEGTETRGKALRAL